VMKFLVLLLGVRFSSCNSSGSLGAGADASAGKGVISSFWASIIVSKHAKEDCKKEGRPVGG
jgi:hypothetical protein